MPEVTCPECHRRQAIDAEAAGYACVSCGTEWDFVSCASCGSRFHASPEASEWRCPSCGTENVRPHARPPETVGVNDLPIGPNRMLVLGAAGVIVLALLTWALTQGGDDEADASPTASVSASTGGATEALCSHLVDIQTLRFDALGGVAATLRDDVAALQAEGNAELARDVKQLANAVAALQAAFDTPESEDDKAATDSLLAALEPIPCG